MRRRTLSLLVFLTVLPASVRAQEPAELIQSMEDAVARFDYATAEARARDALARFDVLSPDQLVAVHTTLGILLHARSEPIEARRQFEAALSLNPRLELDSVLVSPRTRAFFQEIRESVPSEAAPSAVPEIRYVVLADPRPGAALRSLAFPGWGQFHKGEPTKGWTFALTGGAFTASALAAEFARGQAREAYVTAATPAEAERLYPAYNRWYRTRNVLTAGTVVIWVVSAVEALVTGEPETPESLALSPTPDALGVRLQVTL